MSARIVVTSHGGDFFGEDRHPAQVLTALAAYAQGVLPADGRRIVVKLLRQAADSPAGATRDVSAAVAGQIAPLLRRLARSRVITSKTHAKAASLLADAAERAAADGEQWTLSTETTCTVRITSYGVGHQNDPGAGHRPVVVDTTELRNPPDDPDVRARLTQMTGLDPEVQQYVLTTAGATQLIARSVREIEQRARAGETTVEVLVHCYGGRHRSVAIAETIGADARTLGYGVHIEHRHIDRPILPSRLRD
ncbi:hypothetical protein ACFC8F_23090 [Streptomyces hydrogenans]|uniref:RapZ C-terminal domain-containing protein n=1 Tax=Streptomyces hydrogenans TaxID=1873719 RepID=UPI0035DC333A